MTKAAVAVLVGSVCLFAGSLRAQEVTHRPDLTLGSVEGQVVFGRVVGMSAMQEGGVLVGDGRTHQILKFGADGRLEARFGGNGQGPGEFVGLAYLGTIGSLIWAIDSGQSRVSYFSRSGEHVQTSALPTPPYQPPKRMSSPRGPIDDSLFVTTLSASALEMVDLGIDSLPVVSLHLGTGAVDTLVWRSTGAGPLVVRNTDNPWAGLVSRQPFDHASHWAVVPHAGVAIAAQQQGRNEVTVQLVDDVGAVVWSLDLPFEPKPLPDAWVEAEIESKTESVLNARGPGITRPGDAREIVRNNLYVPAARPTVTGLVPMGTRQVLIRREDTRAGPQRWTIVNSGGGSRDLYLDPGIDIRAADGRYLWGVVRDEFDVESVVRVPVGF